MCPCHLLPSFLALDFAGSSVSVFCLFAFPGLILMVLILVVLVVVLLALVAVLLVLMVRHLGHDT